MRVVKGQIRVHGAVKREAPGVVEIRIDLDSKYAEVVCISEDTVALAATDRTIGLCPEHQGTTLVHLDLKGYSASEWNVFAEVSRYTLYVIAWRIDSEWEDLPFTYVPFDESD